jgi:glycosyltransferase involved in cell wall biosynthesis
MASVAMVQDHLVQRGGAERVLLSMSKALPSAPIHTAFYWPEACYAEFEQLDVRPAPIDRVPGLRRRHRATLPVLPFVFSHLRVDADVVVCGTSGWAAGVRTEGKKILYFHSLARWLHERDRYLVEAGLLPRLGSGALLPWLRRWDRKAVESADGFFVYSSSMAEEIDRVYGIAAEVLPPPVTVDAGGPEQEPAPLDDGFVLCPCRLMAYKNVDVVIEAFRARPHDRLVVAGGGPEEERLRAMAPANVTLLGQVDDKAMRWLYRRCRAVVSASYEPFGLVTLEANAFGKPAAVLRSGGFRDTVVEGSTGVFFDELAPAAAARSIDALEDLTVDTALLAAHAAQWSEDAFVARLRAIVAGAST